MHWNFLYVFHWHPVGALATTQGYHSTISSSSHPACHLLNSRFPLHNNNSDPFSSLTRGRQKRGPSSKHPQEPDFNHRKEKEKKNEENKKRTRGNATGSEGQKAIQKNLRSLFDLTAVS